MKYLILFLISTSVHAEFWEPHEKELAVLEWRANHTPESLLAEKYSKIENMDYVREFKECELVGIKKLGTSAPQAECLKL